MKSLKFEYKRFYSSKKNILLLVLLFLVLLSPVITQVFGLNDTERNFSIKTFQQEVTINRQQYQQALINSKQDLEDKKKAQNVIKIKKAVDNSNAKLQALKNQDYATYWKLYIESISQQTKIQRDQANNSLPLSESYGYNIVAHQMAYYHYLLDHHLYFYVNEVSLTRSFEAISLKFINSFTLLPILIIIILSASFFAEVFEDQRLRFYHLIRQSKKTILMNHFLVPFLTVFSFFVGLFVIFYIIFGFLNGWGSPLYPYGVGNEFVTPFWKLDLLQLLFLGLGLSFIITLGQLLTLVFKKTLLVVGIEFLFFLGYFLISNQESIQLFKKFLPFPYLNSLGVTIVDERILFGSQTFVVGAIYLLVMILIFWLVSRILFEHYIYRKGV